MTIPEQEDYSDAEEAVDALLQIERVLDILLDRPQPVHIKQLITLALNRSRTFTECRIVEEWYH